MSEKTHFIIDAPKYIIDRIDSHPRNLAITIDDDWPPKLVDKLMAHYGSRAQRVIVNGNDTILIDKTRVKRHNE